MNTLKDVWRQFKLFIRFDSETILKITQDRYETGNAFLIVTFSLFAIYIPLLFSSNINNIFDLIFFGVLDGTFSWVFSSLVMWFALGRVFKENVDLNSIITITGYSHGLVGFVSIWFFLQNSFMNFEDRVNQVFILLLIFWIYNAVAKSLELGFFYGKEKYKTFFSHFYIYFILDVGPIKNNNINCFLIN